MKIRGVRVEPAEIEAVSARASGGRRRGRWLATGSAADRRLAAYVVARPGGAAPSPAALRAHVAERLPAAMVPVAWVRMPSLPLTANGKVARERLPAPTQEHYARATNGDGHRAGPHEQRGHRGLRGGARDPAGDGRGRLLRARRSLAAGAGAVRRGPAPHRPARRARDDLRRPHAARAGRHARSGHRAPRPLGHDGRAARGGFAPAAVRGHGGRRQPARVRRADPPAQHRAAGLRAAAAGARRPVLVRPQRAGARRALPRRASGGGSRTGPT